MASNIEESGNNRSDYIAQLDEQYYNLFAENKVEYIDEFNTSLWPQLKASSARYKGRPVPFLYQPHLISKDEWDRLDKLVADFNEILEKVIKQYLNDRELRAYFPFSEEMEKYVLLDPGYHRYHPIARFDVFYHPDGEIKFCELNTDGTSAMNEVRVIQDIVARSGAVEKLTADNDLNLYGFELFQSLIQVLLSNYQEFLQNHPNPERFNQDSPVIGILDFQADATMSEFTEYQKELRKLGYKTYIVDPRDLINKSDGVYFRDEKIDLFYRRATTSRLFDHFTEIQPFLQGYEDKKFCLCGSFRSQIIHNKAIFHILNRSEILSDLTKADHEFIRRHIPETGLLKKDQVDEEEIIDSKDKYILKPCDGFACQGVKLGIESEPDEWEEFTKDALKESYLYQKYCHPPSKKMVTITNHKYSLDSYHYLFGLYVFNNDLQGIYNRVGREKIIGSVYECYTVPVYITSPQKIDQGGFFDGKSTFMRRFTE
ncbi:MAG: glutathionylspermidine synthase family protein [Bacillota bacterium]